MPTNYFVPVATGAGANVYTDANWDGSAFQVTGVQTGIVPSKGMNKAWRQGTSMAAVMGQIIVNRVGIDAADDGNIPGLVGNLERGIAAMLDAARYGEDGGAPNTLVATLSPAPVALTPFFTVRVRVQYANTSTAPTLNLNGIGPKTVVRQDGSPLVAGDLPANRIVSFVYDHVADVWRLGGPAASDLLGATLITIPVTKTVGGAGADFANLNTALAWLSNYRITVTGSVTFQMAAGQFVYPTSVDYQHPDGSRLFILGATLKAASPAGSTLTYSGNGASARQADTTANLVALRNVYATEIVFQNGSRFYGKGTIGNLQDILITTDKSGTAIDGIFWNGGFPNFTRLAVANAQNRGICAAGAYVTLSGACYALGCGDKGFSAEAYGTIAVAGPLVAMSNGVHGIGALSGRVADAFGATATSYYLRGNSVDGVRAESGVFETSVASLCQALNNGAVGFNSIDVSKINVPGSVSSSNSIGFQSNGSAKMDASNTSGPNNATYGYLAFNGAYLARPGGTATGFTANTSPAVSTVGNNNAYIA